MSKPGPLSDAQLQDKLRDVQRRRALTLRDDVQTLMAHEWGRRLAYWLVFELGRLHAPSFAADIKDGVSSAMHTARNEGFREMAGELLGKIRELAPDQFLAMMAEQIRARQAELVRETQDVHEGVPEE